MTRSIPTVACAIVATTSIAVGQFTTLSMPPSVPLINGATISTTTFAAQGSVFATFLDTDSGPVDLLGERLYLGLSPAFVTFDSGVAAGVSSTRSVTLPTFPGLLGTIVHGQGIVLDPNASNGLFHTTNAASSALHAGSGAIVQTFDQPWFSFTGNFSTDVIGQLRGGPVTKRTHETIDLQGTPFPAPIQSPLVPLGARQQIVYRAQDLGATGEPELVTAVRWKAGSFGPVILDTFQSFDMRIGHTDVVPDYSVDPWSALPVAPESGLAPTFADNEIAGAPPSIVYQGSYTIDPGDLTANGFLPYPMFATFAYDGTSSMLFDIRAIDPTALGVNGMELRLMVQSSPLPGARLVAGGNGVPPAQLQVGAPDNAMPIFEIEFTRVQTYALSPWIAAGTSADYGTPLVAQSLPPGTSIEIEYRGADIAQASEATAWSNSPEIAEGHVYLQYRVTFHANPFTGERPLINTLVIPIL